MTLHKKHCKRILKQYGKHIKAFENRNLEPSKEIQEFREKYAKDRISINPIVDGIGLKKKLKIIKGVNLDVFLVSILNSRYGFASREVNKISCYDDLVFIANS